MDSIEKYLRTIPDFPKPGVLFRDVTGILESADGIKLAVDSLQEKLCGLEFDRIAAPESRGFLFGMPLAYNLHKPFVAVRKPGKLPCETVSASYDLEYGSSVLEMHRDAIRPGDRVVIFDDLLATGGTTGAIIRLIEALGGRVEKILFLIELKGLGGRARLAGYDVDRVLAYDGA